MGIQKGRGPAFGGVAVMMSERTFARRFSSYWQNLLPMADHFIRSMNLNPFRYDYEIESKSSPDRRAFINETSFLVASYADSDLVFSTGIDKYDYINHIQEAEAAAVVKIALLEKRKPEDIASLSDVESVEVQNLSKSIFRFIESDRGQNDFLFSPVFPGCGMVSECAGDLRVRDALCELKAGDRGFRSQDLRQVFAYICLNYSKPQFGINRVCIVNPRRGTKFEVEVNSLCKAIAGRSFYDVAGDLVKFMSEVSISR